ncbi:glutathione reductase [Weissella oryzae SG25]|uniref:Glutathione reductase n=1 Tax=Weissella oryzae (strain DSM 25784 / JCM 18191 / LMG 30913 / SG25) TaxID=1329250 RepID=A0A069CRE2_WEIOS|nr:NAD(P)/FAD-dependent oxidoreductase [Weissella oryzae]GAK30290.1 glutathione reductase [Weissella oryzae SG25]
MFTQNYDYDVLYIGSGHGTFDGAIPLAAKGVKIAVVEAERIGGTCPNWGCNAKIILDNPVALKRHMEDVHGIVNGSVTIDWPANMAHKEEIIDGLPQAIEGMMTSNKIDVLFARAKLVDAHTVDVNGELKTADKIVISTGLRSNHLTIPGTEFAHDSRDFLALETMPKHITIIGGGYIALEFATMANEFGAQVNLLLHGDQALRAFPQAYVEQILADLAQRGVNIKRNVEITALEQSSDEVIVHTAADGEFTTDWVLDATGRIPNVENIGLEAVGVDYNQNGIVVDEYLRTSVPNIYASGDIIDKKIPKLTPTAVFESTYLMHTFAGDTTDPINYPVIPTVVFTSPRIAQVGVSLDYALANPDKYTVQKHDMKSDWFRQVGKPKFGEGALIYNQAGQLVGATELSEDAAEVINTLLPAIEFKFTAEQLERLVYLFPSIGFSAHALIKKP